MPMVYRFEGANSTPRLVPAQDGEVVSAGGWRDLAGRSQEEPALLDQTPRALAARWNAGNAAIAICHGEIVSYVSLIPVYNDSRRQDLSMILNRTLPRTGTVFETATGWTAPELRGLGLSSFIRSELYRQQVGRHDLIIAACRGVGASRVLQKFGFAVSAWSRLEFLSSLLSWVKEDLEYIVGHGWLPTYGRELFNEDNDGSGHIDETCDSYTYLWVSKSSVALHIDTVFRDALAGDLESFRVGISTLDQIELGPHGLKRAETELAIR